MSYVLYDEFRLTGKHETLEGLFKKLQSLNKTVNTYNYGEEKGVYLNELAQQYEIASNEALRDISQFTLEKQGDKWVLSFLLLASASKEGLENIREHEKFLDALCEAMGNHTTYSYHIYGGVDCEYEEVHDEEGLFPEIDFECYVVSQGASFGKPLLDESLPLHEAIKKWCEATHIAQGDRTDDEMDTYICYDYLNEHKESSISDAIKSWSNVTHIAQENRTDDEMIDFINDYHDYEESDTMYQIYKIHRR